MTLIFKNGLKSILVRNQSSFPAWCLAQIYQMYKFGLTAVLFLFEFWFQHRANGLSLTIFTQFLIWVIKHVTIS